MQLDNETDSLRYHEFQTYKLWYYLTEYHKYDLLCQYYLTDIQNGEMDGRTNDSFNRSLKTSASPGAKNVNTVWEVYTIIKLKTTKECFARQYKENDLQKQLKIRCN